MKKSETENTLNFYANKVLELTCLSQIKNTNILGRKNKIIEYVKKVTGLTQLLLHFKSKCRRLEEELEKTRANLSTKESELGHYINKFLANEQRWEAINYINKNINSTLTIDAIYKFVDEEMGNLLDVDFCAVSTYDDVCRKFFLHCINSPEHQAKEIYLNEFLEENFCLNYDSEVKKEVISKILNRNLKEGFKAIPLMNKTKMFGVIFVYKGDEPINEEHFKVLNMAADNISMALINAQLYSKMQISNKRKLEYIANLSHEFKTPLNAINGFTTLIYDTELPRDFQQKYCINILNASKHLLQVAEYTVDMARAESNKVKLYYEKFNPTEIVLEVLSILDQKIKQKEIILIKNLTNIIITADKRRFKQLIFNLVGNALKFNKFGGELEITTKQEGTNFYFEVRDTGIGINPDEQYKIFEFFSHINSSSLENKEGSGIGLSLSKSIINLHKGDINFKSKVNEGSVFWFTLPIRVDILGEIYEHQS